MKQLFLRIVLLCAAAISLGLAPFFARAAEKTSSPYVNEGDRFRAALAAADDERTAATKSGDRARLDAIFSDGLHYAHSNGKIDTKASYMEALTSRATVYESFEYKERKFTVVGSGIATMTGRVLVKSTNKTSRSDNDLNFLAVWREENGKWRFLAWQSCKNLPPAAATPAAAPASK